MGVNLSTGNYREQELSGDFLKKYLGGTGFTTRILYDEVGPETDPLAPENVLIMAPGLLVGPNLPTASETSFGFKAPVTGFEFSNSEIMTAGERVYNLSKAFNVREGFSREDDSLPERVIEEEVPDGPSKGESIDKEKFERELDRYYTFRGWDEEGVPLKNTLKGLDLPEISEDIGVTGESTEKC